MPVDVNQLGIVLYPDPVLRATAQPVQAVTEEVCQVAARMLRLMHDAPGVGLAAPQVGLSWRLFVANATGHPEDDHVFINPVISPVGRHTAEHEEGCLSLPDVKAVIHRPRTVTIQAVDLKGHAITMTSDGLAARIWQHEFDHLDGVLIIDRMTQIDKIANKKVLRGLERVYTPDA